MNNTLPIVVLPSRWVWGFWALIWAVFFTPFAYLALTVAPGVEYKLLMCAIAAPLGFELLQAARNCLFAPPRMIIDESGVGGRFVSGGFGGAKRVAWEDIIMAHYVEEHSFLTKQIYFFIILKVDNTGGKYPVGKFARWWSLIAWWEKFLLWGDDSAFAFNITDSKLSEWRAKEIVEIINRRAKAKPHKLQESGKPEESDKSPFAAD